MKFSNVDDWRSDHALELAGVDCDLGRGRVLIVRRAGSRNREYMAAAAQVDPNDLEAMQRIFARTVVCGWRGFLDERGEPIEYSLEACAALFVQCPDLADHVARFAADRAHYHAAQVVEDAQSLKATPGGLQA